MTGYRVHTENLAVSYDRTPALSKVTLDLAPNRIHGLLGRNGAGKTTLMSVLAALRRGTGTILVDGQDPFENQTVMQGVCLIRESGDLLLDERLTTNLDFLVGARPTFDRTYAESLMEVFRLPSKRKVQTLSRGQQSAFGAIVGLASRAPLTMFDEVHLGMDAPSRQRFYDELLREFAERPRTIVLSSHLISEIEHMLETVTILHEGRLLLSGEADDLQVVGTRDLGPTRQVTVFGELDEHALAAAQTRGLQVGAVPLQDLFIHLTDTQTLGEAS